MKTKTLLCFFSFIRHKTVVLKKKHDFQCPLDKVWLPSKLEVQFLLKCDQPQARGGANLHPPRLQIQSVPVEVDKL